MRAFCCCVAAPRFVTERSRVLFDRAVRDLRRDAHSMPAVAGIERGAQLRPFTIAEFWPAETLTRCARPFETRLRPLADLLTLKLCERGEGGQEDVADELVFCRQMLLCEGPKC